MHVRVRSGRVRERRLSGRGGGADRARRPRVVLARLHRQRMGYARAVAAKLGLGFASDVHASVLEGDAVVATRAFYGAKLSAEVEFPGRPAGAADAAPPRGSPRRGPAAPPVSDRRSTCRSPRARGTSGSREAASAATSTSRRPTSCSRSAAASADSENVAQFEELAEQARRDARASRARWSTPGWCRARARSASRARRSSRRSTSRSASRARSSTSPACDRRTRSSPSTPTRRRRSSASRTTARSPTSSTSPEELRRSSFVEMTDARDRSGASPAWLEVLWYVLAAISTASSPTGVARPLRQVPARAARRPPHAGCPGGV